MGAFADRAIGAEPAVPLHADSLRKLHAIARRLPSGALYAVLFAVLIHTLFSRMVFPHPVIREDLRRKVYFLTQNARPGLLFAGDSRVECAVDPIVLADAMNLEHGVAVNIAVGAGNNSGAVAAIREFRERFSPNPIVVLSVSPHVVSSRGNLHERYNAEHYWKIGWASRFRELSVKDAVCATFAPERRWLAELGAHFRKPKPDAPFSAAGFRVLDGPSDERPGHGYTETIARLDRWRCFTVGEETSPPWRRLRAELAELRDLGAQIVVFDAPHHPEFLAQLSGTPQGRNYARFRATLAQMCRRLDVPLMRYVADDLGSRDPDELFWDGVHVNEIGARILSKRVAVDLERLISTGELTLPAPRRQQRSSNSQ